jgi:hypothetical protein
MKRIIALIAITLALTIGTSSSALAQNSNSRQKNHTEQISEVSASNNPLMQLLAEKARSYSDKAEVAVGKAIDTVQAEAPGLVKEFLGWRIAQHLFYIGIPIVIFLSGLVIWKISKNKGVAMALDRYYNADDLKKLDKDQYAEAQKKSWKRYDLDNFTDHLPGVTYVGSAIVMLCAGIATIIMASFNLLPILQIILAPRIYIFEQAVQFLR